MTIKEMYDEISDEEFSERCKNFQNYSDEEKDIILEKMREKIVVEEETEEKKKKKVNKNSWINQYGAGRFIIIFYLMGIGLVTIPIFDFMTGFYSLFWEKTDAKIIYLTKKVEIIKSIKNGKESVREKYSGKLIYEYKVEGKTYKNTKIYFNNVEEASEKDTLLRNTSEGDTINISYNPKNPNQSIVKVFSIKYFLITELIGMFILKLCHKLIKKSKEEGIEFPKGIKKFFTVVFISFVLLLIKIYYL